MEKEKNIKDLGCANAWWGNEDSLEYRLVEMTRWAGLEFTEERIDSNNFRYTCKEAGLTYRTNCS